MPNTYLSWPRGVVQFIAIEAVRAQFGDDAADGILKQIGGYNGTTVVRANVNEAIPELADRAAGSLKR